MRLAYDETHVRPMLVTGATGRWHTREAHACSLEDGDCRRVLPLQVLALGTSPYGSVLVALRSLARGSLFMLVGTHLSASGPELAPIVAERVVGVIATERRRAAAARGVMATAALGITGRIRPGGSRRQPCCVKWK